jgi:protein TonB
MFKVLTGEKKRRVISPATITASIVAHLLLLGGAVYASGGESTDTGETRADTTIIWDAATEPPPPPPPPPLEQPTPPAPTDDPVAPPVPGETLEIETVTEPPDGIKDEPPGVLPVDSTAYTGRGPIGTVIGPPTRERPVGPPAPPPAVEPFVPTEDMVEVRPVLDRNGLGRALERHYPSVLRDSRVSGRVVVQLIVDENGRPVAGSAQVIEASHPAFEAATLRAVDRFRFRPARMGGTPVPVRVTIPIVWTAQ